MKLRAKGLRLIAFSLMLSVANAEAAPVILRCKMESGLGQTYKIDGKNSAIWSQETWAWIPSTCTEPNYDNTGEVISGEFNDVRHKDTIDCDASETANMLIYTLRAIKKEVTTESTPALKTFFDVQPE